MTKPEPAIHNEVSAFAEEIAGYAKQIGRLETLIELQNIFTAQATKTKSVIEKRTLEKVVATLEGMN